MKLGSGRVGLESGPESGFSTPCVVLSGPIISPLKHLGLSEQDTKPAKRDSVFVLVQPTWTPVARGFILDIYYFG